MPLHQRRARLEYLLADAPPALALCPQTSDVELARSWFDKLGGTGTEGRVVKDLAGVYRVGGRGSFPERAAVLAAPITTAPGNPRNRQGWQ